MSQLQELSNQINQIRKDIVSIKRLKWIDRNLYTALLIICLALTSIVILNEALVVVPKAQVQCSTDSSLYFQKCQYVRDYSTNVIGSLAKLGGRSLLGFAAISTMLGALWKTYGSQHLQSKKTCLTELEQQFHSNFSQLDITSIPTYENNLVSKVVKEYQPLIPMLPPSQLNQLLIEREQTKSKVGSLAFSHNLPEQVFFD